jgi:hypothetical protein
VTDVRMAHQEAAGTDDRRRAGFERAVNRHPLANDVVVADQQSGPPIFEKLI